MSRDLTVFLPESVTESDLRECIADCEIVSYDRISGVFEIEVGGRVLLSDLSFPELELAFEGEAGLLAELVAGRSAWGLNYRNSVGQIRDVVVHLARRWPLYVDNDNSYLFTGAEFTWRFLTEPEWDCADRPDGIRSDFSRVLANDQ